MDRQKHRNSLSSLNYDDPHNSYLHTRSPRRSNFGSRTGASTLPSLPVPNTSLVPGMGSPDKSGNVLSGSNSQPSTPYQHEFNLGGGNTGSTHSSANNMTLVDELEQFPSADRNEGESYIEFDLGGGGGGGDYNDSRSRSESFQAHHAVGASEKFISNSSLSLSETESHQNNHTPVESPLRQQQTSSSSVQDLQQEDQTIEDTQSQPLDTPVSPKKSKGDDDDFFTSGSNWKAMKTIAEMDYYNDRGELEYSSNGLFDKNGLISQQGGSRGYTKIDTEEQVAKYAELDKKTDFLFQRANTDQTESAAYGEADLKQEDLIHEDTSSDSEYDDDDNLQSNETLETTKGMLTEAQKFAYVGISKLIAVEMATDLAKLKSATSSRIAKTLMGSQKNFANWMSFITMKLFEHLELTVEEQRMIENLSVHGLEVTDLTCSLIGAKVKIPEKKSIRHKNKKKIINTIEEADLVWILICDLFLLLLSEGYYDSRSRSLVIRFAQSLEVSKLEIFQFERRLIDSLEIDAHNPDKSFENKEELLNDRTFIDKHIKKNKKKRLAFIGLATLGGGLAIGLSAGLLAPVIGAGLAAGLTTVGITGTSGFLAGVGGSAIITTGGIFAGARVGSKAGSRRIGDVHTFELKPLHNNKRTNLILTVSGWMNGELDDVRLPFSTVDPVMGDMFSLLWEPEMLQSMGQTIGILASEALTTSIQQILGATVLTALMSAIQLPMALSKLSYILDNPWNVSLDRAWKAGKILADTLIAGNLGVRPITLVGFSLGARLIYSCLIELAKRGGYGLIENVIILGSPITVKVDQLAMARSVVSGRFINGYSKRDWILGYLFRATGGGIQTVAGLQEINHVHGMENVDCTDFVEGHMSYRKAIPKILKTLDWEVLSEEFAEIEEPDPEQGEKTRKLINEFDEARAKMLEEQEGAEKDKTKEKKTWKNWFKPANKDKKEWWDVVKTEGAKGDSKNGDGNANATSESTPGDENQEYSVEDSATPMPIFDLSALQDEVKDIERIAAKDEATLASVRNEVDELGPEKRVTNEDAEAAEENEDKSFMSKVAGLGGAIAEKVTPSAGNSAAESGR